MDFRIQGRINSYQKSKAYLPPISLGFGSKNAVNQNRDKLTINHTSSNNGSKAISNSFLDVINFDIKSVEQYLDEDKFAIGGTYFSRTQIPEVQPSRLNDLKAVDNVVTIQNGKYYKYTDSSGNVHKMSCANNLLSSVNSEGLRGVTDAESAKCGQFWNIMSDNGTFIREYYSDEEIKEYLGSAGITEGFFTVGVGKDSQEYFYSNGNCGRTVLKGRYDTNYNVIKNGGYFFSDYKPGTIIKVDGNEYTLSENHTLDIPYGADIFNIEYPPKNIV